MPIERLSVGELKALGKIIKSLNDPNYPPTIEELRESSKNYVYVVRCCDCKHKKENPDINNTWFLTCNLTYGLQGTVDPTDFCSYGERKTNNE